MGIYFGSKGIMASIAVGKIILIVFIAVTIFVRTSSLRNFMFLPESFGGNESDNIYVSIKSAVEVMRESRRAETFCLNHGSSARNSKLMALFIEEAAGNIIAHGKPKRFHRLSADYWLSYNSGKICMTLCDCCGHFNPSEIYEAHKNKSAEKMPGMKIFIKLVEHEQYLSRLAFVRGIPTMIQLETAKRKTKIKVTISTKILSQNEVRPIGIFVECFLLQHRSVLLS